MTSWLPYGALGGLPIPPGLPGLPPPPPPFAMVCLIDYKNILFKYSFL
jgi:hypothetical protein